MSEVRDANREAGFHFFDPDTMRFFDSRIETRLIDGRFFVTSEKGPDGVRRFTVRRAMPDGTINTVGDFQGHATRRDAEARIEEARR